MLGHLYDGDDPTGFMPPFEILALPNAKSERPLGKCAACQHSDAASEAIATSEAPGR